MVTKDNVVSISQMRKDAAGVLGRVETVDGPLYLFSRSQIKAVLVSPEKFAEMEEMVEDYLDQRELLAVRDHELKKAVDWKKAKAKLLKDGN